MNDLRQRPMEAALAWERTFGIAPCITSALSEFDAAMLIGRSPEEYSASMCDATGVGKGHDFTFNISRYQVKANRPSVKPGSFITLVPKAKNYEWDFLIWLLYDQQYQIQEARLLGAHKAAFDSIKRLSPSQYRKGKRLV